MKIYAFLGRKKSGKDTAAKIVKYEIGSKKLITEKTLTFAGPIKDALSELTGTPRAHFDDQTLKEQPIIKVNNRAFTPRALMTWYGNLMREKFGPTFWLDKVKKQLEDLEGKVDYVFITDARFVEEVQMIDSVGGTIFYLDRDVVLGPLGADADISERVVYNSKKWAKENARNYIEISNNDISVRDLMNHFSHILTNYDI